MSCSICCQNDCNGCEGIPQAQGLPGQPAFLNLNFIISGIPSVNSTNSWKEMGRFIFSKDVAALFTSIRMNIWVTAGTGSYRIKDIVSGTVIYTNSVTSPSNLNIETKKALQIYNASSAIIAVETQGSGVNSVFCGSAMFAYEI